MAKTPREIRTLLPNANMVKDTIIKGIFQTLFRVMNDVHIRISDDIISNEHEVAPITEGDPDLTPYIKKDGTVDFAGAQKAFDHNTGTNPRIVNICYGTSETPPAANTTTIGTLYIQYTA